MKKNVSFNKTLVKIMQVSLVQLLLTVLFLGNTFAGGLNAQAVLHKRISLQMHNKAVKDIIGEIKRQSQIDFAFSNEVIEANRKVSVYAKNQTVGELLNNMLSPLELTYKVSGELIIITKTPKLVKN